MHASLSTRDAAGHTTLYTAKKYPYIRGYFAASFPHFTEPVPYTSVSVNRRNNEALGGAHIAIGLRYSVDLGIRTSMQKTGSIKIWKTQATKYLRIYGYFLQCMFAVRTLHVYIQLTRTGGSYFTTRGWRRRGVVLNIVDILYIPASLTRSVLLSRTVLDISATSCPVALPICYKTGVKRL